MFSIPTINSYLSSVSIHTLELFAARNSHSPEIDLFLFFSLSLSLLRCRSNVSRFVCISTSPAYASQVSPMHHHFQLPLFFPALVSVSLFFIVKNLGTKYVQGGTNTFTIPLFNYMQRNAINLFPYTPNATRLQTDNPESRVTPVKFMSETVISPSRGVNSITERRVTCASPYRRGRGDKGSR